MNAPNYPYSNDETGLDDFDQPFLVDETDEELEAYLMEKRIDREDSGMAGV